MRSWLNHKEPGTRAARRERDLGRAPTAFSLLGGRAAVEETLQMQDLQTGGGRGPQTIRVQTDQGVVTLPGDEPAGAIPIDTIPGVQVKSHPYAQMLRAQPPQVPRLSEMTPPDRFFVHFANPRALSSYLNQGADFMGRLGSSVRGNSLRYDLKEKYLKRLGLNEAWLKRIVGSGFISECAAFVPDLFFIDGTDITFLARITQPERLRPMLTLVGADQVSGKRILSRTTEGGLKTYWVLQDDVLVLSSNLNELHAAVGLASEKGTGSLGRSAEFRYMLTQLAPREQTWIYAYFSDSFIRRLVGPEVKISQLRRVKARANMEYMTAMALLAKLDGTAAPTDMQDLVDHKYLTARYLAGEYRLGDDFVAQSERYGTPARLATLLDQPTEMATQEEADAYKRYVDNYSRYWRQFFDPIAIRVDSVKGGDFEITTFILPLIDSSAYNGMREFLNTQETGMRIRVPVLDPEPVVMLSLAIKDSTMKPLHEGLRELQQEMPGLNTVLPGRVGPGFHLAVHDAQSVLALGSGDLLGAFNSRLGALMGNEMLIAPIVASVLTRPCTLLLEAERPAELRDFIVRFAQAFLPELQREAGIGVEVYGVEGRDTLIWAFDAQGVFKLRLALDVEGDFLSLRNIPWSNPSHVINTVESPLATAWLQSFPRACRLQLSALHANALERDRRATMSSVAQLFPLVVSGLSDLERAPAVHARLFGSTPLHRGEGQWLMEDGEIASSAYGTVARPRQPPHTPGDREFGLFRDIDAFNVAMQFEHTGLRTILRWRPRTRQ